MYQRKLTQTQADILRYLQAHSEGVPVTMIADCFQLSDAGTLRSLISLEKRGYVECKTRTVYSKVKLYGSWSIFAVTPAGRKAA